jgi:hypothetical protein
VKPDDSSLDPADLRAIELRAKSLLDRAAAWDRFPTPIDDILAAARVRVAPVSIFDPASILAYLKDKAARAAAGVIEAALTVKSALSKVFGLYDGDDELIHIDQTVGETKQNFRHIARPSGFSRTASRHSHRKSPISSSAKRTTLQGLRFFKATATHG